MADSSSDDAPHLSAFLQVRLVELGLDYDTYGPYVLGIEVGNNDIDIDNDDDIDNDEEAQEQVDQVCQLLQASSESETYADDDAIWTELGRQIFKHIQMDNDDKKTLQQARIQFEKQQLQDQLFLAKQEKIQLDKPTKQESSASKTPNTNNTAAAS